MDKYTEQQASIAQLTDVVATDREGFRLQATCKMKLYSVTDRKQISLVNSCGFDAYEILQRWHVDIYPRLVQLDQQRTKNSTKSALIKYLNVGGLEAEQLTNELVIRQQEKIVAAFIDSFLPASHRQITVLTQLLSQPYGIIASLRQRYLDYLLHVNVAEQSGLEVYDTNTSWLKGKRVIRRINTERRHIESIEYDRLLYINERIEHLSMSYEGLLGKIIERDWDLIVIVSLKNKYEKEIQELPTNEAKSPTKRLTVFERITSAFSDEQIEKLAQADGARGSLRSTRLIAEDVDELLLRIFDLTNAQKNQLLVRTKEARELIAEKEDISNKRDHRQQLLEQIVSIPV
jgi:hypothetical protein